MKKFDLVQTWLDNVAYSHSKSEATDKNYRFGLREFCEFIGCRPQQILNEYEQSDDREFKRKYARFLKTYISQLASSGYAVSTVQSRVTPIKSFFKYNDLPLGYVPIARKKIAFHNRDIKKREIEEILKISNVREQAFFCVMAQSGLRPITLCGLRIKHIEPDFSKGALPCKIEVPEELAKGQFGAYFTFMGEESVKYLKRYLTKRGSVGPEDYLFAKQGKDEQLNRKSASYLFTVAIEKLKQKGIVEFEQKQPGKPRELRMYSLRKYFRKNAYHEEATIEYVNFWMGHKTNYKAPHIPASDDHYFSREDVEFQRHLYKEHSMPQLRLETATPSETEKTIEGMRMEIDELRQENLKLKKRLNGYILSDSQVSELLRRIERLEKKAED